MNVVSVGGGGTARFARAPFSGTGSAEATLEVRVVSSKTKEPKLGKCMMRLEQQRTAGYYKLKARAAALLYRTLGLKVCRVKRIQGLEQGTFIYPSGLG
jgi:hypothetical protein